jgi:PAS domain S-box-containing protein
MELIPSLLRYTGYYDLPYGPQGWGALFAVGLVLILVLIHWRKYHPTWTERSALISAALLVSLPVTALFLGLELPASDTVYLPNTPALPGGSLMMFFLAVPWVMAAGLLGPAPAAILAGMSGAVLAYFDSHNPFIPLIYALLGTIFSVFLQQNYRTWFYRLVSHPLVAAFFVSLIYPFLFIFSSLLVARGEIGARLDYGISHAGRAGLAFAGQLFIAAVVAEVVSLIWTNFWEQDKVLKPSPAESSLEVRLVYSLAPVVILVIIAILIGQWVSMVKTTQNLLGSQMENITKASAAPIPIGLETGQNLINQLTEEPRLYNSDDPEQLSLLLAEYLNRVPFFNQLIFLDENKELLAGYPVGDLASLSLTPKEWEGIDLALRNVAFQSYSLAPETGDTAGRIVFISNVRNEQGSIQGVILGRTSLDKNPFFTPVIENLNALSEIGGVGMLLDEQKMILVHPDVGLLGTYYTEVSVGDEGYFDSRHTAMDGSREMLYVEPVPGRMWVVVTLIPSARVQQAALNAVLPLFGLMLLLLAVGYLLLRLGLGVVVGSIRELAEDARLISEGDLDRTLEAKTVDEVGQLGIALEEMRIGLKARVEEANRLLTVSKGVASALEMQSAVTPILQGALATGATAARLILTDAAMPEYSQNMATEFSLGPSAEKYRNLDKQILALSEQQSEVVLTNPARARLNNFGQPLPLSLMAMALTHEGVHYGTLWVAYDEPKRFTEDDIRFLSTVAGQAALAAANTRLYLSAELGRQRMEAVLSSTSEPVLVTDYQDNLLLINPAARELLGGENVQLQGRPVREVISEKALLDLLLFDQAGDDGSPVEVKFRDGRVFFATASPVDVDGKQMGRVCLLRDVTHYKELDALKSEFVDTVSHDLRSPLTLMRGYATMLQMVGELNEQQTGYINKIGMGVESMSRLVNNLLDLGRIDVGVGLRLEIIPAGDILKQVADKLKLSAVQKQIEMGVYVPEDVMPLIQVDQALLEQALHNLIENAIKYTDPGGKVEIALILEGNQAVSFVIRDSGIGIAPVDLPRLFERFFRAAGRKTREQRGSGLGLAIVKSIAERHGGSVHVESQLGRGSTFTLRIPLRQPDEED